MQLTSGQQAALPPLLAEISAMTAVVTILGELAADNTATLTGTVSVSSASAGNQNLTLPPLTAAESVPFFAAALSVFQARLAALDAQMTAL